MAARAMSFDSHSTPERWHLGRKLTLLFLLVIAAALGLVILFRQRTTFHCWFPICLRISASDWWLGSQRGSLRPRNWFFEVLASAALAVIGLFVLGYFTNGKIGMTLPPVGLVQVHWLSQWHISLELPLQIMNVK